MDPKQIKKWRDTLGDLLDAAGDMAQNGDFAARMKAAADLQKFIIDNPASRPDEPETAEFDEMDKIARQAHDALLLGLVEDRVTGIMSQTAELAALTKKIQSQTAANEQAAKSIKLEKARKVVVAVTDTVSAMQDLKTQLETLSATEESAADLAKSLGKAIGTLQDLRAQVESTG